MIKITAADLTVCEGADSFLQSAMWGRFKSRFGWKAQAFSVEWGSGTTPLLALSRRIAPGISMAYIPWGPELPANFSGESALQAKAAAELACALRPLLRTTFIRFDPPWGIGNGELGVEKEGTPPTPYRGNAAPLLPTPFTRAAADIQPPDTVLVDLTPSEPEILAAMKPKWRYNIGLAEKHGVVVSRNDVYDIETFYRLLSETASRDGIAIHNIEYYRGLFEECASTGKDTPTPHLYTATHEGDALAAIVTLFRGKQATYLYGASANIKRNLMAPYALQWKAMQDAKDYGCAEYDLFGIPPNDDPSHPMAGLYRFKTGFGGRIVHRPGSWDYPVKPLLYTLFRTAEAIRKKLRDRHKRKR